MYVLLIENHECSMQDLFIISYNPPALQNLLETYGENLEKKKIKHESGSKSKGSLLSSFEQQKSISIADHSVVEANTLSLIQLKFEPIPCAYQNPI
jgi:hypothetical protein